MSDKTGLTQVDNDDFSLDDIDDLPGFKCFPTGAFHVKLPEGLVQKKIGEHQAEEVKMVLVQAHETKDMAEGEVLTVGDICSTVFMRDNPTALGKLKEFCKPIAEKVGSNKFSDIRAASKGLELMVVGKRTHDKEKDRDYFNIITVGVL